MVNLLEGQDEIIARLKVLLPDYEKNILPLFNDSEAGKATQFTPAIFVAYGGLRLGNDTANANKVVKSIINWIILIVYRDARGAAKCHAEAGAIMATIIQGLQGFHITNSLKQVGLTIDNTPRQYNVDNAAIYPLVFKHELILKGT